MQNNSYTDQEMIWAAQLSYIDFTQEEIDVWKSKNHDDYPTVRELLLQRAINPELQETIEYLTIDDPRREDIYGAYYQGNNMINSNERANVEARIFIHKLVGYIEDCNIDDASNTWNSQESRLITECDDNGVAQYCLPCADWKVYSVRDMNNINGLYAFLQAMRIDKTNQADKLA